MMIKGTVERKAWLDQLPSTIVIDSVLAELAKSHGFMEESPKRQARSIGDLLNFKIIYYNKIFTYIIILNIIISTTLPLLHRSYDLALGICPIQEGRIALVVWALP